MSSIDLVVSNVNAVMEADGHAVFPITPKDSTGTGVDITGGTVACSAWLQTDPFGSNSANSLNPTIAIVSSSAGKAVLDISNVSAVGNYNMALRLTPSGGTAQLMCTGTLQIK